MTKITILAEKVAEIVENSYLMYYWSYEDG